MRLDHTLHGLGAPEPFAPAIDEPVMLSVGEQNWLACQLVHVRRHWYERGKAPSLYHRAEFHRCVSYDANAGDPELYIREAGRR